MQFIFIMSKKIAVGIDVGTYQVKVVVAELIKQNDRYTPRIIDKSFHKSKGLRHGYIINKSEVTKSILQAVSQIENSRNLKIKKAFISIGGVSLEGIHSKSITMITRADGEITNIDIANALSENENSASLINRKIIHSIPLEYKIDNKKVLGNPVGMKGEKLKSEALFIACLEQHIRDLVHAVEETGIEIEDIIASPVAGSFVTLTKAQKIAGCVLANLGAETVSIIVFENNIPISLEVFPTGSTDVTNDIALGLKISLEEAEKIKHGVITSAIYSRKELEEIVAIRLESIFKLIEAHLKKIGRDRLLPAGIIISGGGSGIATINDFAKASLRLPSRVANLQFLNNGNPNNGNIQDSTWAVAYGLCLMGLTADENQNPKITEFAKGQTKRLKKWIKQFFV